MIYPGYLETIQLNHLYQPILETKNRLSYVINTTNLLGIQYSIGINWSLILIFKQILRIHEIANTLNSLITYCEYFSRR